MDATEFAELEKHVEETARRGGCEENMFLGPCDLCERYYDAVEQAAGQEGGSGDGE